MKDIKLRTDDEDYYAGDVKRIAQVLRSKGYNCDSSLARQLWEAYSNSMAAGWMHLPEDDSELFWCVQPYFVEESDDE